MQTGKNCGMIIGGNMSQDIKSKISAAAEKLESNYKSQGIFEKGIGEKLPNRAEIIEIINETRRIIFPGYFGNENTVYCRNISIKGQTRI